MTVDQARAIERDLTTTPRALLVLALSEFRRELDRLEAAELERWRTAGHLATPSTNTTPGGDR